MKQLILTILSGILALGVTAQPSDNILMNSMAQGNMPGASFVVIKEGKWVYNRNLGVADIPNNKRTDSNTIYMMASVSKTMIATAAMQLWEQQLLDLDIDVNRYLNFQARTPSFPNDSITMRMLLTHTSAIQDEWNTMGSLYVYGDSPIGLDSFLRNYFVPSGIFYKTSNFYSYQPGTTSNYSNIATVLAAYVVERITGDVFSHYCDTAIFKKLCMSSSSFLLSGIADTNRIARPYTKNAGQYIDAGLYGYPDYPDGQLRSSVTDMARFMTMYMQYGQYEGTRILDSSTVAYMLQQQSPVEWDQGIIFYAGVSSSGDTLWGHNGGDAGVNTGMYFSAKTKTGTIVLTNGDGTGSSNADLIVNQLYSYGRTVTPTAADVFPACNPTMRVQQAMPLAGNISIYPNPNNGTVHVNMPATGQMNVYNMQGSNCFAYTANKGDNVITLPGNLPAGVYVIKALGKDGSSIAQRLTLVR